MNIHYRAAIKGALWIGVPFGLWTIFLLSSVDSTSGSVISFGVGLPAIILGLPWSLYWVLFIVLLHSQNLIVPNIIAVIVLVACPSINGAIRAYRHSKHNET